MARVVDWTYELPPLAGDTAWLEPRRVHSVD
jgi:hypothetical protein